MIEKLKIALAGLSTEELSLINMLYSDLKSEREIAAILGISQKTVNKVFISTEKDMTFELINGLKLKIKYSEVE